MIIGSASLRKAASSTTQRPHPLKGYKQDEEPKEKETSKTDCEEEGEKAIRMKQK